MPTRRSESDDSASVVHVLGATANRRDLLKTATGLVATVAAGGAFIATTDDAAAALAADRTQVKVDVFNAPFEILSWSYGIGNTVTRTDTGATAGRAAFSEVNVMKVIDQFTAPLQLALAAGTQFSVVTIGMFKAGVLVGRVTLNAVFVTNYALSNGSGDPTIAVESVTFNFGKITFLFQGKTYTWDTVLNTGS